MPLNLKSYLSILFIVMNIVIATGQELNSYNDLLSEGIRLQRQRDFEKSSVVFRQILTLDTVQNHPCLAPEIHVQLAYNQLDIGAKVAGENIVKEQIESFDSTGCNDPNKKLRLYQCSFIIHREIDNINGSKEIIDEMLNYHQSNTESSDHYLVQINKLYSDYYSDIGDNYTAIAYAEQSMKIRRQLYQPTEYNYVSGLYSLANFTERIGDYERSDRLLDTIINVLGETKVSGLRNKSYHMRSLIAIRNKEYDIAKTYAEKALQDQIALKGPNSPDVSFPYQELGAALLGLGQKRESIDSYNRAYDIRRNYFGPYHRLTLSSLSGLTRSRMSYGDTLSVIEDYKDIVNQFALNYTVGNADKYVSNVINVGKLYQGAGLTDSAKVYYQKALDLCNEYYPDGDRLHWQTHLNLASVDEYSSRPNHIRSALYHAVGDSQIYHLTREQVAFSRDKQAIIDILTQHAENLYQHYEHTTKLEYLKELVSYAEQYDLVKNEIFNEYLTPKSIIKAAPNIRRLNLLRLRSNEILYRETTESKYLDQSLISLNESKNLLLQVELFQKNLKTLIDIPDRLIDEERRLYNEINRLQSQESNDSLKQTILELERQYFDIRKNIIRSQERLGDIRDRGLQGVSSIRSRMKHGQLLINYFLDEGQLFIYYLSRERQGLEMRVMGSTELSLIEDYISTVSSGVSAQNHSSWNLGYDLYQLLMPSTIDEHIDHLTIIPDNNLYLLPFDVLLTEELTGSETFVDFPYLINRYQIDYMAGLGDKYKLSTGDTYGSAVGYAPFIDEQIKQFTTLPLLAYSDDEIDNINEVYGIDGLTGQAATKEHFLSMAPNYDIIHIASHAVINAHEPINSNIIFYPSDSSDKNKLYLWELYNQNLPTKLAVLSACQTSDGSPIKGAGVINIARGFYTAGAQAVVSNLWPTQDYSASQLMKQFYTELDRGGTETEALHSAKMYYKSNQIGPLAHPKYWAGWIIQRSELSTSSFNPTYKYMIIAGVVIGMLLLMLWIRRGQ